MPILTSTLSPLTRLTTKTFAKPLSPIHRHLAPMSQTRSLSLSSYFITPADLSTALPTKPSTKISTAPRIIPLCASWFLPNDPQARTGLSVYKNSHIPTARFFDLDAIRDPTSPYPHMLPPAAAFAKAMREMGINKDDTVIIYDSTELGLFSAPRVGWTFKVFGHPSVHILNNYRLWVEQGYTTESGEPAPVGEGEMGNYPEPEVDMQKIASFEEMKDVAQEYGKDSSQGIQILDARPYGRWAGTAPEPRPGLSSGHMPSSISIPHSELLDAKTGTLLPREELRRIFEAKGVDPERPIVSSCGTGVTAAVVDAALEEAEWGMGRRVYDGSWT